MSNVTLTSDGKVALPQDVREKHGFKEGTPIRIVETRTGILLIPLTGEPMSEELKHELAEWQALSLSSWKDFPYTESPSRTRATLFG